MQFWWVNHGQTLRQEIDGQYMWSPKREANGARSQFYDNMRLAAPGDLVLSYAKREIAAVGRVLEFAFNAPKPSEFGNAGTYWSREGWLLPVSWMVLTPPFVPKNHMQTLSPLLPTHHSPLQINGGGSQKAYLASISETLFTAVVANTDFDRTAPAQGGREALTYEVVSGLLEDTVEREINADVGLEASVKQSIIQARRGQGKFRQNVEAIDRACRLTGVTNPALLIASHIKPWRLCATTNERLDGMNGLLLTPNADLLFDRGLISFGDGGDVLVSSKIGRDDLCRLGFEQLNGEGALKTSESGGFTREQQVYLQFHRAEIFIP